MGGGISGMLHTNDFNCNDHSKYVSCIVLCVSVLCDQSQMRSLSVIIFFFLKLLVSQYSRLLLLGYHNQVAGYHLLNNQITIGRSPFYLNTLS